MSDSPAPLADPELATPWLHRLAVACVWVALVPIVFGALTTTQGAGMAVPDYPQTFGQNMFTYNMFGTGVTWDVFLEHTHRLGGSLIGLLCLAFFGMVMIVEDRRWMRVVGTLVLLGVISQGLLGGVRVLRNMTALAMTHGFTAALFFALLCFAAIATGRGWGQPPRLTLDRGTTDARLRIARSATLAAAGFLAVQYLLGGLLRHFNIAAVVHVVFAAVAWIALMAAAVAGIMTGVARVRRVGWMLAVAACLQVALGLWAYVVRYGAGLEIARDGSAAQVISRTSHMVVGVLLVAATASLITQVLRTQTLLAPRPSSPADGAKPVRGIEPVRTREEVLA